MGTAEIITLAVAIIGAVTGITGIALAYWSIKRQVDNERVNLRIGTSWGMSSLDPRVLFFVISVTNLSKFPVTLREVGLLTDQKRQRAIHPHAQLSIGERLPLRMEPRTSISVHFPPDFLLSDAITSVDCAYASTDCGETVESTGNDVKQMVASTQENAA